MHNDTLRLIRQAAERIPTCRDILLQNADAIQTQHELLTVLGLIEQRN